MDTSSFFAIFTIFLIQILTTRTLNDGILQSSLWCRIWIAELILIGFILPALLFGYKDLARWMVAATVSIFLLRASVRGYDYGVVKLFKNLIPALRAILKELASGIESITTIVVGLFATVSVAVLKALPEAMADAVKSDSKSDNCWVGLGRYNYRTQKWDNGLDPAGRYLGDDE